jgi:hypothetical protein
LEGYMLDMAVQDSDWEHSLLCAIDDARAGIYRLAPARATPILHGQGAVKVDVA